MTSFQFVIFNLTFLYIYKPHFSQNTFENHLIMKRFTYLLLFCVPMILNSCGCSSDNQKKKKFVKNPVDELIKEMSSLENFTIILHDMDVEEGSFEDKYFHVYKIIKEVPKSKNTSYNATHAPFQLTKFQQNTQSTTNSTSKSKSNSTQEVDSLKMRPSATDSNLELVEEITSRKQVSEDYFFRNENNMGMEIASKKDGKVSKEVAPAGFSNYVGNEKYGQWKQRSDGSSFWEFYGKYAMMTTLFSALTGPMIYRSHYMDYRSNYYGTGRPYYGRTSSGGYAYGTRSSYMRKSNPSFYNRRSSKSSWSSKSRSASSYSSSSSSSSTSRSSSGSMRSKGGGFGK